MDTRKPIVLSALSADMHQSVLQFCDAPDLARIAVVSRYWAQQANNPRLWRELAIHYKFTNVVFNIRVDRESNSTIRELKPLKQISIASIKLEFANYFTPERLNQRAAEEFKQTHPIHARLIKTAFIVGIASNIPHEYDVLSSAKPIDAILHRATIQLGLFARGKKRMDKLIDSTSEQADSVIQTITNAFSCCRKKRSN